MQRLCSRSGVTTFPDSNSALCVLPPFSAPVAPLRSNYYPQGNNTIQWFASFIVSLLSLIGQDCEKLKAKQDPHIHMQMWGYIKQGCRQHTSDSRYRDPNGRAPAMAPTIPAAITNSQEHLPLNHKLRKPLVEKLRRERINSSIEQLKTLLGPEFLKQQPDSKLEKADILEMTVCFLRRLRQQQQQQHPSVDSVAVDQGYSRCVQEVVHFLSKDDLKTQSQRRLLNHFNNLQSSSEKNLKDISSLSSTFQASIKKEPCPTNSSLWRPW
ncbi:transcription factor HES-5-like [Cyprinodon tularosa]|uniref:transcription factor HES-5-like n=1 Tax=Cyprinodon tularosa TaxID=77115 RepID=UPI0018E234A0|nr:transcription factor HES-5-like [Cyprinodon tularosa]